MLRSSRLAALLGCSSVALALLLSGCNEADLNGAPTPVTANKPVSLPGDAELAAAVDEVVDFTENRHLSAKDHAAWQVVHGILAYGRNLRLIVEGEPVSALDYLLEGGELRGWAMKPGDRGLEAILEAGSKSGQGHEDQWLGYVSQCGLELDDPIVVGGQTFKFGDLLTQAKWDIYEGMEATWTLMALSAYLPSTATWTARDGKEWSVEKVIGMEAAQDLGSSPCGGSHRMGAIAMSLNRHLAEGGALTGGWKAADDKVQACVKTVREFQQPDGTFSTNYWIRSSTSPDTALRLNTTGHTLEFLCLALTDEQLKESWVTRAAAELCNLLQQTKDMPVECGGLYHAIHGLEIYRLRRFGPRSLDEPAAPNPSGT